MSELQFKYLPCADLIDHPIDMEPNVRLSFLVSIAVPYATLIKAERHSDLSQDHKWGVPLNSSSYFFIQSIPL